jgi:hypothetical protein
MACTTISALILVAMLGIFAVGAMRSPAKANPPTKREGSPFGCDVARPSQAQKTPFSFSHRARITRIEVVPRITCRIHYDLRVHEALLSAIGPRLHRSVPRDRRFWWCGRSPYPQSGQDDEGYSETARSKIFELAVSPRNKKLAELKDTSTDRIEAANQDRRQTGVGRLASALCPASVITILVTRCVRLPNCTTSGLAETSPHRWSWRSSAAEKPNLSSRTASVYPAGLSAGPMAAWQRSRL